MRLGGIRRMRRPKGVLLENVRGTAKTEDLEADRGSLEETGSEADF